MRALIVAALVGALVCGCAGGPVDTKPNLVSDVPAPSSGMVTGSLPGSGYQLSEEELKYDCKRLTGLMQIRILQVRGYDSNKKASAAARGMQSFATPIWGGTKEGVDPEGQHRKDLAMLEAYNQRLAEKRCKTFNLAAELATTSDTTPAPVSTSKVN
ncbi:MAG: hypothetical protein ACK4TP_03730 [Hyphomicrobium sp.]|jgi:hypothetical protein